MRVITEVDVVEIRNRTQSPDWWAAKKGCCKMTIYKVRSGVRGAGPVNTRKPKKEFYYKPTGTGRCSRCGLALRGIDIGFGITGRDTGCNVHWDCR